jgi:hypothetical protein
MREAVARPQTPTPLAGLGNRPFSFYPPLRNTEHNEWILSATDWDEFQVINRKSRLEVSIPHRYLGGVSSIDDPVMIVGLRTELELREGAIVPCVHRVIEMPRAVNETWAPPRQVDAQPGRIAPVIGIRVESNTSPPVPRKLMAAAAAGLLACVVTVALFRDGLTARDRYLPGTPARIDLPFTYDDNYQTVVNQLGEPTQIRPAKTGDGRAVQLLRYPQRGFALVIDEAHYIGAVGRGGRVLHSVQLSEGQDSTTILRRLKF